jgi:hypothetical protein
MQGVVSELTTNVGVNPKIGGIYVFLIYEMLQRRKKLSLFRHRSGKTFHKRISSEPSGMASHTAFK